MIILIILLVVLFAGGGGYFYRENPSSGIGLLGLVLIILLICWLLGVFGDAPHFGHFR